jgi:hypothetical protein
MDRQRFAKTALMALLLGASACDEPSKTAADQHGSSGDAGREGIDRAGTADKSHCGGDGKQ